VCSCTSQLLALLPTGNLWLSQGSHEPLPAPKPSIYLQGCTNFAWTEKLFILPLTALTGSIHWHPLGGVLLLNHDYLVLARLIIYSACAILKMAIVTFFLLYVYFYLAGVALSSHFRGAVIQWEA